MNRDPLTKPDEPFKLKSAQDILNTLESLGLTPKPYSQRGDNYFITYSHEHKRYWYFTVNDGHQSPERIYMSKPVAEAVCRVFNTELVQI